MIRLVVMLFVDLTRSGWLWLVRLGTNHLLLVRVVTSTSASSYSKTRNISPPYSLSCLQFSAVQSRPSLTRLSLELRVCPSLRYNVKFRDTIESPYNTPRIRIREAVAALRSCRTSSSLRDLTSRLVLHHYKHSTLPYGGFPTSIRAQWRLYHPDTTLPHHFKSSHNYHENYYTTYHNDYHNYTPATLSRHYTMSSTTPHPLPLQPHRTNANTPP